ncbi:MAG TPA: 16S rRNA (adenine(1518)-N(6)/adenine(1519)-N(6))-dimethyltransferase RsmA [Caldisericia bacterium]|nr:16S rRNA (adenine(1518)-N(6)/adenine(1519)-N(6))-dimethyltransferase RsmA [Caldisericia bacterium]HPI83957.1 16S rRNA (adenine(1518)-N(6)/adenine(1519)-N(6))-dimethyltransferase RsmA [Caldisericia bacterium]HPQ92559.1 16S rRNA (adenine(1518)-N(6)/adenine(1519)-N(6))-dimethyltransferase RsmA [Caldisericia bacterium]
MKSDLARYEIKLKRRFSQNFCHDQFVIDKIMAVCGFDVSDWVLEIGAGTGVLTTSIASVVHRMVTVEIDTNLRPLLLENLEPFENVKLIFDDILLLDMADFSPSIVVGNLPYYCASAIIKRWINQVPKANAFFMLPDDVVRHLEAKPCSKDYTAFSVYAQYACEIEVLFEVHPSSFFPRPNVGSSFVSLKASDKPRLPQIAESHFMKVVEGAFYQRRKTMINSLVEAGFKVDDIMSAMTFLDLDRNIRGEELTVDQFKKLAGFIPI